MALAEHLSMEKSLEETHVAKRFSLLQELLPIIIYLLVCIICSTYLLF